MTTTDISKVVALPSIYSLFKTADEGGDLDIMSLVDKTFESIDPENYAFYLKQALSRLVYTDINQLRKAKINILVATSDDEEVQPVKSPPKVGKGQILAVVPTESISAKRDERRHDVFNSKEKAADGSWIRFGQSTYDDLMFQSERLMLHGEQTIANAKLRAKMAEAVQAAGVKTLEELPNEALVKFGW